MVTLGKDVDLDAFYDDMETPGGNLYIPDRAVDVANRRPISRSTEYWLTQNDVNNLRNDPRVISVELNPADLNIEPGLTATETTGTFARNSSATATDINWGILRMWDGYLRTTATTEITTTVSWNHTGRNVDLVICDGDGIVPNHPEFLDSNNQSRVVQYNWYQHNPQVTGGSADTYSYGNPGSYHANHVMGTAGGNPNGWARDANLYNIYYYAGAVGNNNFPYVMDYIREFHRTKADNPDTGRKNPTVINNSWGMSIFPSQWSFSSIDAVTFRGTRFVPSGDTTYNGTSGVFTSVDLLSNFTADPENITQRIETTGSEGAPNGEFSGTLPTDWSRTGGEVSLNINTAPATRYTIRVQGPSTVNCTSTTSSQGLSGISYLTSYIQVFESDGTTEVTSTTDTQQSVDGGQVSISLAANSVNLPNNEIYQIHFDTALTEASSPTTAMTASVVITNYQASDAAATVTSLGTNQSIPSVATLTASVTPTSGNNDDGYWSVSLPFNVSFLSTNYSTVYMGTNSYLTFGSGSSVYYQIDENTPSVPKIMVTAEDCSCQRIYYGAEGTTGSRTFRLVYEGNPSTSGTLGSPTVRYQYTFYEATPSRIDLLIEGNSNKQVDGSFSNAQLNGWGFISGARIPVRVAALDADIEDAIDEGLIYIGAAGNGSWKHDVPGGPDWDNTFEMSGNTYYYMRGTSPTANDDTVNGTYDIPNICVGATDTSYTNSLDRKVYFSDCGPGVDIYAPGHYIQSPLNPSATGEITDARDSAYRIGKISGTSMASPQVAGIVACMMEAYPHFKQEEVKEYLLKTWSEQDQLYDATATDIPTDSDDLQGSPNNHAKYHHERPLDGTLFPKSRYTQRPTTGALFPRPKRSIIKGNPEPGSAPASNNYSISVGNVGSGAYTMSGSDRNGSVGGSNPTININSGDTLTLNVNASGHPLFIKTVNSTGTGNLVSGVSGQGTSSGSIAWNTSGVAAGTYYYNCQYHSAMYGLIVVS